MRGSRAKALRRAFKEDYGFAPPKARRVVVPIKPKNVWQRIWWWITKQSYVGTATYHSTWRRLKKMVKVADRTSV